MILGQNYLKVLPSKPLYVSIHLSMCIPQSLNHAKSETLLIVSETDSLMSGN